jgi:hypothetical protein
MGVPQRSLLANLESGELMWWVCQAAPANCLLTFGLWCPVSPGLVALVPRVWLHRGCCQDRLQAAPRPATNGRNQIPKTVLHPPPEEGRCYIVMGSWLIRALGVDAGLDAACSGSW